jgi:hypothetical protein
MGKIACRIVAARARRMHDFAHADVPNSAPCPPYNLLAHADEVIE